MLKLTIAVLAVALAGTASAAGWKSLRVDGSSEEAFAQSLAVFKDKLSPVHRHVFGESLKDIWVQGVQAAEAEQREYTAGDYYRQIDGLTYKGVVRLTDPTGEKARQYQATYLRAAQQRVAAMSTAPRRAESPWPARPVPQGFSGEQRRGGDMSRTPLAW